MPGRGRRPCLGAYAQVLTAGAISIGDHVSIS